MLVLAIMYGVGGWLGLKLAVPPGFATVIWPASGIATAALLLFGRGLWPGVFLGSFVVNAAIGHAIDPGGVHLAAMAVAAGIAGGSSLQAVIAATFVRRLYGRPVRLETPRDVVTVAAICGPLSCLIAPTVGVLTLTGAGIVPISAMGGNWFTWWVGDMVGVLVFMPLGLFNPWRTWDVTWAGRPVPHFSVATLLIMVVPLGLTFYAWRMTSEMTFQASQTAFSVVAADSRQALLHRLAAYRQSLDGGVGLFAASEAVGPQAWENYVAALDIANTLPGINGLGYIERARLDEIASLEAAGRQRGYSDFSIHPETTGPEVFAITLVAPIATNRPALGLNIAFETHRHEAALHSRDTGNVTITRRIFLVQDKVRRSGFLLMRPVYAKNAELSSVEARRRALQGWVYAPFIGDKFMQGLTESQGDSFDVTIHDGTDANPGTLIFASKQDDAPNRAPLFSVTEHLTVMEQNWTVRWDSTPQFEANVSSREPVLILAGGISLSLLLGGLLLSYSRREESIRQIVGQQTREIVAREQENKSIVDSAVVAILVLGEDGRIHSANRASENIFGYTADELIGASTSQLLAKPPEESFRERLKGYRGADGYLSNRTVARRKDGREIFIDFQINEWRAADGQVHHTAVIQDVTAQQLNKVALEEAEARWKFALEGARMGVFDINLAAHTSFVSSTWLSMLGFDQDDKVDAQAEWLSRVHPDDLPHVTANDLACREGLVPTSESEYRIRRKDGEWAWHRSNAMVVERDENGAALRMLGTQTDITELKRAEASIKASEEKFRSAMNNAPVGMVLLDMDGGWLSINKAACDLLGYREEDIRQLDFQAITHPDDVGSAEDLVKQLLRGEIATFQIEKRYRRRDGNYVWTLLSVSLSRGVDGKPEYYIAHVQNIDDRKEIERMKSEFVATVSHELRTPLTSIRGSLGLVTGAFKKDLPENVLRLLSIAHKNCERLIVLINDILDLEKIANEGHRLNVQTEDINAAISFAVDSNESYASQFGVRYVLENTDGPVFAQVDPDRLQQVFANLLSNAAKFSPAGGSVEVVVSASADAIRVAVIDHGPGISEEFKATIFGRFAQADGSATRKKGGTGLGLNIAKQITEKMGGTIGFESEEGAGATFWIELPRIAADAQDHGSPEEALALIARILHIEDDADFSEVLGSTLTGRASLINAGGLESARQRLAMESYDLIIVDPDLPDGDGIAFLDEIATLSPHSAVILLSAADAPNLDPRVDIRIVKSKMSESAIAERIMTILASRQGQGRRKSAKMA